MSILLQTLVPVFGLMALGFAAARGRIIDAAGSRGLVLFAFNFSIPALLLTSMAGLELPTDPEWAFLVAFYGASIVVYAAGVGMGRFVFGRPLRDQAIFGMGAGFSNLALIGIPVVLTVLGPEAALPMMVVIGFHSATVMPVTVLLIQSDVEDGAPGGGGALRLVGDVLRNPIILGILVGFLVNVTDVTLWQGVQTILDLLGAAAVPCALFAMGASLAGFSATGDVSEALALTVLKLVLHPFLVWLIAVPVLGSGGLSVAVAVVLAAMPSAVNVYLFGARYDAAASVAARTVLLTTVGSAVSIAVVLLLLGV